METRVVTGKGPNGEQVEVATIVHEGREFTSLGSIIDLENGRITAYVREGHAHLRGKYFDLVNFKSEHIAVLHKTGESRGFYSSRITHFSMVYQGYSWHGKVGLDWKQLIHLKRGRKV